MESQDIAMGAPVAPAATVSAQAQKFSLFALIMMVVGSMVGAGIWSLPRAFGTATGVFGAIVAWTIAAGGMYTLARVFQALAERKPDLDAGVLRVFARTACARGSSAAGDRRLC
jgi:amino acid transporter